MRFTHPQDVSNWYADTVFVKHKMGAKKRKTFIFTNIYY